MPFGLILFLFLLLTAEDAESAEGFRLSNKFREKSKMLSLASLGHTRRSPIVVGGARFSRMPLPERSRMPPRHRGDTR